MSDSLKRGEAAAEAFLQLIKSDSQAKATCERMAVILQAARETIKETLDAAGQELAVDLLWPPKTLADWQNLALVAGMPDERVREGRWTAAEVMVYLKAWADRRKADAYILAKAIADELSSAGNGRGGFSKSVIEGSTSGTRRVANSDEIKNQDAVERLWLRFVDIPTDKRPSKVACECPKETRAGSQEHAFHWAVTFHASELPSVVNSFDDWLTIRERRRNRVNPREKRR